MVFSLRKMDDQTKLLEAAAGNGIAAKLLVGEQVEVRQLDKGLRGSWHPAVVVKVNPGRRIVEYDELLSTDGISKLRESIPVPRAVEKIRVVGRQRSNPRTGCGLLRPRPPTFSNSCAQCWSRGLLVDAFYQEAWWEGVLLQTAPLAGEKKASVDKKDVSVMVFFPDEGDKRRIPLKKLRLSLYWNEVMGDWSLKGQLNFDTVDNLLSIVEIWKRDRRMGADACKKQGRKFDIAQGSDFTLSRGKFTVDINHKLGEVRSIDFNIQPPLMPDEILQLEGTHRDRGANVVIEYYRPDGCSLRPRGVSINPALALVPQRSAMMRIMNSVENCYNERTLGDFPLKLVDFPVCKSAKKAEQSFQKKPENRFSCSDVQRSHVSRFRSKKGELSKALVSLRPLKKKVEDRVLMEEDSAGNKNFADCIGLQSHEVGGGHRATFPYVGAEYHRIVKKARDSAKKMLLEDGWQFDIWERRDRGKQHVYISPDGSKKCWSLAKACKFWRKYQNISSESYDGENCYGRILDTYDLTDDLDLLGEYLTRAKKRKLSGTHLNCCKKNLDSDSICKRAEFMSQRRDDVMHAGKLLVQSTTENPSTAVQKSTTSIDVANIYSCDATEEEIHGNKMLSFMTPKVGLKTSDERASEQGSRFKESLPPPSCEMLPFGEKCKQRKSSMQDSQPLTDLKHPKDRKVMKKIDANMEMKGVRSRGGCHMQVLLSLPGKDGELSSSQLDVQASHLKKHTVLSWLIDMGVLAEDERVCYVRRKEGRVLKEGHVSREGVICSCCKTLFTLSNFEFHAGSRLHRPSANMFMDDGRSLLERQMQAWALQNGSKKHGSMMGNTEGCNDNSDDTCRICGDGGKLILCDNCPSTFHACCIGLEVIPEGDWFCSSCCCAVCGRSHFSSNGDIVAEKTAFHCDQCEREYHISCLGTRGMPTMKTNSDSTWFCRDSCQKIYSYLRGIVGIVNPLEEGLSCTLLRCMEEEPRMNMEVVAENNSKLSVALTVMQECFRPMVDPRTKIDRIAQILYNRRSKFHRLNCRGFYTILLERGDEIISVASVRVHGLKVAEMPLIGTRFQYRRKGMCRRLIHALEEMLRSIGVEKLILPAVPELLDTWLNAFSFQYMTSLERRELMELNLVSFPGTTFLQKFLAVQQSASNGNFFVTTGIRESACQMEIFPCDTSSFLTEGKFMVQVVKDSQNKIESTTLNSINVGQPRGTEIHSVDLSCALDAKSHHCHKMQASTPGLVQSVDQLCALDGKNHHCDNMQASPSGLMHKVCFFNSRPHGTSQELLASGHPEMSAVRNFFPSGGNKPKGQRKCRLSTRGLVIKKDDDPYCSKVVLTTTRSKRLVKSSRWVVDALKELCRKGNNLCHSYLADDATRASTPRDLETANGSSFEAEKEIYDRAGTPAANETGLIIQRPTICNASESPPGFLTRNESSEMIIDSEAICPNCNHIDVENALVSAQKVLSEKTGVSEELRICKRTPDSLIQSCSSLIELDSSKLDAKKNGQDAVNLHGRLSDCSLVEAMSQQGRYKSSDECFLGESRDCAGKSSCIASRITEDCICDNDAAEGFWNNTKHYSRRRRKGQGSLYHHDVNVLTFPLGQSLSPSSEDIMMLENGKNSPFHLQVVKRQEIPTNVLAFHGGSTIASAGSPSLKKEFITKSEISKASFGLRIKRNSFPQRAEVNSNRLATRLSQRLNGDSTLTHQHRYK